LEKYTRFAENTDFYTISANFSQISNGLEMSYMGRIVLEIGMWLVWLESSAGAKESLKLNVRKQH